ncbi:hypothetical protein [Lysinibacillus parviboronicapiens]|uniref:hypothetical protein n=1 Tax=Lysinibacillus parviboronicapiens TaxID=436516 RepID=UPI000D3CCA4A|nr:hypothetical protein [Lysinibacillus parviboronicapiens]
MATQATLTEATRFFNEHFPEGSAYDSRYSQVSTIRSGSNGQDVNLRFQRLGNQLQFLASLHDKLPSSSSIKESVKTAILATFTSIEELKNSAGQSLLLSNANLGGSPAGGIVLAGLVITRTGVYHDLDQTNRNRIAFATDSLANQIASWMDSSSNPSYNALEDSISCWRNQRFANFAVNGPILHVGGLGLYLDLIATYSSASQFPKYQTLYKYGTYVMDKWATLDTSQTKASLAIGGLLTINSGRKFFPSSGYNAYVGMGLAWLAHGMMYTGNLGIIPDARLICDAKKINNFYQDVFHAQSNMKAYEISEPADFTGEKLKEDTILAVVELGYSRTEIDQLLTSHLDSSTGYLYTLAWNGDAAFLTALDKAVRTAGETVFLDSEATDGSSIIIAYSRTGEAAAHRAMAGFAGMLQRGILTVSDGI